MKRPLAPVTAAAVALFLASLASLVACSGGVPDGDSTSATTEALLPTAVPTVLPNGCSASAALAPAANGLEQFASSKTSAYEGSGCGEFTVDAVRDGGVAFGFLSVMRDTNLDPIVSEADCTTNRTDLSVWGYTAPSCVEDCGESKSGGCLRACSTGGWTVVDSATAVRSYTGTAPA